VRGEYFDNIALDGEPRLVRTDRAIDFGWTLNSPGRGIPFDWYSVRWSGALTVPAAGVKRLGVEGNDGYRLFVDGALLIDNWRKQSYGARLADVNFAPGSRHDIRLEFFESVGNARVKLVWDGISPDESNARIAEAVALARRSEAAIVVAGVEEGEFRDRAHLGLPGRQEDLLHAVAATGTPLVVVLIGGSAVTMPWVDTAGAIIDVWYPGERGGEAIARVLFGDDDPAGRLPITFPMTEGQLPLSYNHEPTGRGDDYVDSSGKPAFPFGFGLSYTSFEYSKLAIEPADVAPGGTVTVRCTIQNTGARSGDEVVQLYLRDELASVARPVQQLAGFRRLRLAPGAREEVAFRVGPDALRVLDRDMRWVVEPGTFRVMIGASSTDIRLRGRFVVK
jgi:beta-glucosidase